MSELYLVRHAQASFGEDNYDLLSGLGHRQSRWLGEYFSARNMTFDRVICGDMVRHRETAQGIGKGMGLDSIPIDTCSQWNEFDFERLVEIYLSTRPGEVPQEDAPRHSWFQVLRKALLAWSEDRLDGELKETWAGFEQRVREALTLATEGTERNRKVLVVSSGGPISMALRYVLEAPAGTMIRMNLQTRNSSFSQLFFNERSIELAGFNHVPHLDRPDRGDAVTYY